MSRIIKFSQTYDPAQDRIAIDTESDDGATRRLWITQRLARRMVAAMAPMLRTGATAAASPENADVVQSFEQAAALAELARLPPVKTRPETVVGLVLGMRLTPSLEGVTMALDHGAATPAVLALKMVEARQFLAMLRRLFAVAEWPADVWPAWITAEPAQAVTGSTGAVN